MTTFVDLGFAAWLKSEALEISVGTASAAQWPTQGVTAAGASPFSTLAGAEAEASRRAALLGRPLFRERVLVPGERADLLGRCVTIEHAKLGYDVAPEVLVIGVSEQLDDTTVLTVLRRADQPAGVPA